MIARGTAKVAISMPRETFRSVERARRNLKLGRSEAVVAALRNWLREQEEAEMVRQYVEGYRRHPESRQDSRVWSRLAGAAFHQDPW